jgi:hypothetical protein
MPDVTKQEIDDAFYRSYGEGTPAGLNPKLVDGKAAGKRRKLSMEASDEQFCECWMETARLLREERACAPAPGAPVGAVVIACPAAAKNPDRPKYEPAAWNDNGAVQGSTNCYAYAMNSRLGHSLGLTPQPGEKSGKREPSSACPKVTAAVVKDGVPDNIKKAERCPYNQQQHQPPPEQPGYYLVALVSTSKPSGYDAADGVEYINDYHWYRQDENGAWSHKPGTTEVRNTDSAGKPITNPETAKRRSVYAGQGSDGSTAKDLVIDYDVFCGYFYVKKGGATVGQ